MSPEKNSNLPTGGEKVSPTAGEFKVEEYVRRIQGGESKDSILSELPPKFKESLLAKLSEQQPSTDPIHENSPKIPPQYEGLSADILEDIWTIPIYVDPQINAEAQQRKKDVLAFLRAREKENATKIESETARQEDIEEVRNRLHHLGQQESVPGDEFGTFKMKNGMTEEGYYWYEYRNMKAREMSKNKQFEWGKERIYFDIPTSDMLRLRDVVMNIASVNKIPVAFKYQDEEKTWPSVKDGTETRFVANFASSDDALKFYSALRHDPVYQGMKSDRNMSYGGYRVDGVVEYANGYREQREPLKRIMSGSFNSQRKWVYPSASGKMIELSEDEYNVFKKTFDGLQAKMIEVENKWKESLR